MNLDPRLNPVAIVTFLATIGGLGLAFQLGRASAYGNYRMIGMVFGAGAGMLLVFTFREFIWLLIPLLWNLTGRVGGLPLPFNLREIGVLAAFSVFVAHIAMKRSKAIAARANMVDVLLWVNLVVIAVMWLRRPAGVAALGFDVVGGRPYFSVIIGLLAYLVLSRTVVSPKLGYRMPFILLIPSFFVGGLGVLSYIFPSLVPILHPIYSGLDVSTYVSEEFHGQQTGVTLQEGRFAGLSAVAIPLILLIIAYVNPLRAMNPMNTKMFALLLLATIFAMFSGFRSIIGNAVLLVVVASYVWGRGEAVVRVLLLALLAVGLLVSAQNVVELPRSVQRSLSFLPGAWNEEVVRGAQQSTDWRWEMWEIALTSDRYIQNKWLGDGFGFTRTELEIMFAASIGMGGGFIGDDNTKEAFMIQGSFHSGPVSTIRFSGYTGLAAFVLLMIVSAGYAFRLLRRAWDTPYRPWAIVGAVSGVVAPIMFVFVFGEYRNDFPTALYGVGMLKMLDNSLLAHAAETRAVKSAAQRPSQTPALAPA